MGAMMHKDPRILLNVRVDAYLLLEEKNYKEL